MGIIQRIKEGVKNIANKSFGPKKPTNEQVTYTATYDEKGAQTNFEKRIVSDQPPKKKFSEKVNDRMKEHTDKAQAIIGSHTEKEPGKFQKLFIQKQQTEKNNSSSATSYPKSSQKKSPSLISRISKFTGVPVSSKGVSGSEAFQSIRSDVARPGNAVITAFTGVNPQSRYSKIQKKRMKLSEKNLGKKISKKEAKSLQKKYGKNWAMAVSQNKRGDYFASDRNRFQIKRENMLDSSSVNFGSQFPEPSVSISGERIPFVSRKTDPFDIDAGFIGLSTPMLRKNKDQYDVNSQFKGKIKL